MKVYGWDASKLADAYSFDDLNALRAEVEAQHAEPLDAMGHPPGLYFHDAKGRKKLQAIAWAVTYKLQAAA